MSKWRYGCGKKFEICVQHGYGYREITVECGSTAIDGGVNQCDECEKRDPMPPRTRTRATWSTSSARKEMTNEGVD